MGKRGPSPFLPRGLGRVVVQGTPEMVANHPESITGKYLRKVLG